MEINSGLTLVCYFFLCALFHTSAGQNGNGTGSATALGGANSNCVELGVEADGFLENIDPKKFLFTDVLQKSYLQQACDKYKRMRAQKGCVPQQQNSIYDYACDTILSLATATNNAACWSRTNSCALANLLPPTDSITAAYCKFLAASGVQLACANELAPPCQSPTNQAILEAAARGKSFLDNFQCAVLTPSLSAVTGASGQGPVGQGQTTPAVQPPAAAVNKQESARVPFVLKSKLPECDFSDNAQALLCASNLIGVQEKFSDDKPMILQELAKENSTDLQEICGKFITYQGCITGQVFENNTNRCLTKSRFHDFALLFYTFCDPANLQRKIRTSPCVRKLVQNSNQAQLAQFNQCKENLIKLRANVRITLKEKENALALCEGLLYAERFFDCVKPLVTSLCAKESLDDMAFFEREVANQIETVGCPLDDPRLSNVTVRRTVGATVTHALASSATRSPTTAAELFVTSATVSLIEAGNQPPAGTGSNAPMARVDLNGNECSEADIAEYRQCYANISNIDFDPMAIIKAPDQLESICNSFVQYQDCRSNMNCYPPAGDGLDNMLSFLCDEDGEQYKSHMACLKQASGSTVGKWCRDRVLPKNLMNMNNDEICEWTNEVVNCSYSELVSKCNIDTADYQFKIWSSFAKGVNTSCFVEVPELSYNETPIGVPINCDASEATTVDRCVKPFEVVVDRLSSLLEGGMQAFMSGMKRITEIFKSGCNARVGFDECMRKSIPQGSKCYVSSCLIKVSEYACNVTGDSDMPLEDRLKCLWSMIGDPDFGKCLKFLPRTAFQSVNRIKLYLPRFVNCLETPLLNKCGRTTLNLVKALSSQSSANPDDQTCAVRVPGLNDQNATGGLSTVKVPLANAPSTGVNVTTTEGTVAATDSRPMCKKPEEMGQVGKCHEALAQFTPSPIKVFNDLQDLDPACNAYKNFSSCSRSLPCQFQFSSAIQQMLLRVCTVRYNEYKENAKCLISLADSPSGTQCTAPLMSLNLTQPQTNNGETVCQTMNTMIGCINPDLTNRCGQATDLVYDLHVAFAKQFKPDCDIKPPVLLVGETGCTQPEMAQFESCMSKVNNYSINPISIIAEPDHFDQFCNSINTDFPTCLKNGTCSPKPYGAAFNETFTYVCSSSDFKTKYDKYKTCLWTVLNSPAGQQCAEMYKGIQWYGGDDPQRNAGRICKGLNSTLSCAAPEISQRCEQEAVQLVYETSQRMATGMKSDCALSMPTNLPTKLNLTTTETPSSAKTTPPKAKEAPVTDGAALSSLSGRMLGVCCILYYILALFM